MTVTAQQPENMKSITIIPKPVELVKRIGSFTLDGTTTIVYDKRDAALDSVVGLMASKLRAATGFPILISKGPKKTGSIVLSIDPSNPTLKQEGYELVVSPTQVKITGYDESGAFYGTQSMLQLLPPEIESGQVVHGMIWSVPCVKIVDYPRFSWRGMNLDCVRHFMTKDFIKRYIDLLAYYKFNIFHWHLTDDQGWRIEVKKYPRLTQVGAWRKETDGTLYGGYYTQEDIKEIVDYARVRFITVVPEIEMPGHCEASLASYPENACVSGPLEVGIRWGVYRDIYCPGKESTFTFLENVLKEVMDLFPSHYIHIGGDEVPKDEWRENDFCQQLMKANGLKNEENLQSYFIRRIQRFLESNGRGIIGWDEILEGEGPDSGGVVQSWRGVDGAIQAAKKGINTIVSPGEYTYLSRDAEELSLDSVYSFDPTPDGLSADEHKYVLGTEASMWTERTPQETVDSKMFPRLLAIAEDAWTLRKNKNFENFHKRLDRQYERFTYLGIDYGLEKKAIAFQTKFDKTRKRFIVKLSSTQSGTQIVYTVADTLTLENSRRYESPVLIKGTSTLVAQAKMKGRLVGNPIKLPFIVDKALNSKVTVTEPYAPQYAASGLASLVDGIRGTMNFRDGLWQGYEGTDIDATVDLGEDKTISEIGAGFYQESGSWIFMPDSVEYFVSADGDHFENVGVVKNTVPEKYPDSIRHDFVLTFSKRKIRCLKISAKNIGVCPPWHSGAGGKAWLFIDEIFAN